MEVEVAAVDDGWPFGDVVGDVFENCYGFLADGTWSEPLFPIAGAWEQFRNGASTDYSATAGIPGIVEFVQDGEVGPARGTGVLQLEGVTVVTIETPE